MYHSTQFEVNRLWENILGALNRWWQHWQECSSVWQKVGRGTIATITPPEIWTFHIKRVKIVHWHFTRMILCNLWTTTCLNNSGVFRAKRSTLPLAGVARHLLSTRQKLHTQPQNKGRHIPGVLNFDVSIVLIQETKRDLVFKRHWTSSP